jgi:hypothetical protein
MKYSRDLRNEPGEKAPMAKLRATLFTISATLHTKCRRADEGSGVK